VAEREAVVAAGAGRFGGEAPVPVFPQEEVADLDFFPSLNFLHGEAALPGELAGVLEDAAQRPMPSLR